MYSKEWVVYAKAPFGGPHAVIEYLGRYTHKVAISNHRIQNIDEQTGAVTFTYKDYGDNEYAKTNDTYYRMNLSAVLPIIYYRSVLPK